MQRLMNISNTSENEKEKWYVSMETINTHTYMYINRDREIERYVGR